MPTLRTYSLFISHAWRYDDDYRRLVSLLNAAPTLRYRNLSVTRHNPVFANNDGALRRELDDQMRTAQLVLVLAGMYAQHSKWIGYELKRAGEWRKPVVAIRPWGGQRTPLAVSLAADELVSWQTSSIVPAIRRHAL